MYLVNKYKWSWYRSSSYKHKTHYISRADSRFTPSQWETSLQSNAVSHWLGANLLSALISIHITRKLKPQLYCRIELPAGESIWTTLTLSNPEPVVSVSFVRRWVSPNPLENLQSCMAATITVIIVSPEAAAATSKDHDKWKRPQAGYAVLACWLNTMTALIIKRPVEKHSEKISIKINLSPSRCDLA